jgi:hypothetical protein
MTLALVRYGEHTWPVPPGSTLTFGRGADRDIRLGDDPHLSRRAGALIGQDGYLVIRNDSTSKPIALRPPAGEDRVIEPAAATTSLPLRRFDLVLYGAGGVLVTLAVDAGPPPPAPSEPADAPAGSRGTLTAPITLTPTQHRVLLALCEPMLTERGPAARPATYAEIGQRLGLRAGYVRNVVKALREVLTGHGLTGMAALTWLAGLSGPSDDAQDAAVDDFRRALAQWAVRSGWVSAEQLGELDGAP